MLAVSFCLALPIEAGGCASGNCGRSYVSGPALPPFKGSPSRLKTVTAVNNNSLTVAGKNYLIDDLTGITVDGKKANSSAIKPGMRILMTTKCIDTKLDLYKVTQVLARTK